VNLKFPMDAVTREFEQNVCTTDAVVVARTWTVDVQTLWAKDCGVGYDRECPRKNEARITNETRRLFFISWVLLL